MNHTESFTTATTSDGRRVYVKRPVSQFAAIPSYVRLFEEETEAGLKWNHPHILRYLRATTDAEGPLVEMEYVPAVTLHDALLEEPLGINTPTESRQIMLQLFDAVGYLHTQGVLHLDLRPENVLVTRSAHDVKLINPASFYAGHTPAYVIYKEQFSAPELFEEGDQASPASDVYSLGRIMEYLYSYSTLSMGLSKVIARATDPIPSRRYKTVAEMAKAFEASRKTDRLTLGLKILAAVAAVYFICFMLTDDRVTVDVTAPQTDSLHPRKAPTPSNQAEEDPYRISTLHETEARMAGDTTASFYDVSRTKTDEEQALQSQAERLFKKEFRKRAEKVIAQVYTPKLLNGDEDAFLKATTTGFTELDKIQKDMTEQYGLDPALTTRLAADVITELTGEYMSKFKH